MKSKKIILAIALSLGVLTTSSVKTFAQESPREIDNQSSIQGVCKIGDSNTIVSDVLTFDEVVKNISTDNNISIEEAERQVENNFQQPSSKLDCARSAMPAISARAATYRTVSSWFNVTPSYKPTLRFYCQTDEWGSFHAIERILNVSMDRYSNGISKQFGGTVYSNLENGETIYWIVNGDFYNNGTTTVNGNVSIGVGQSGSASFGASYATSHFQYVYKTGYTHF